MELINLEKVFDKDFSDFFSNHFSVNKIYEENIYKTITFTPSESHKKMTKFVQIANYDISNQKITNFTQETELGTFRLQKSNNDVTKISDRTLKLVIPKGIKNGQVFKIIGEGNVNNNKRGDLYIRINIQ